ncbi:unnamed protein product [Heterobilharzia americana]|nr:unnamed protein product [Heterobilharzia americana]
MLLREHAHGIGLHVNLCGAVRLETLFELSKRRNALSTPATLPEFSEKLIPKAPYSLKKFTDLLEIITPLISGKKEDLARVCNEFVEDCVKLGGLCYVETRFCPFTLTGRDFNAEEVLKTILDSFERSSKKYNTEVRSILTIMGNAPKTAKRTLNLAKRYQTHGVVAIDVVVFIRLLENIDYGC